MAARDNRLSVFDCASCLPRYFGKTQKPTTVGFFSLWWTEPDSNQQQPGYGPGTLTVELSVHQAVSSTEGFIKCGSGDGNRTHDIAGMSRLLYQLSYSAKKEKMVELTGIGPATSSMPWRRSPS